MTLKVEQKKKQKRAKKSPLELQIHVAARVPAWHVEIAQKFGLTIGEVIKKGFRFAIENPDLFRKEQPTKERGLNNGNQ